jgi:glutamate-1-semialdehyde 2,1-aminomutase
VTGLDGRGPDAPNKEKIVTIKHAKPATVSSRATHPYQFTNSKALYERAKRVIPAGSEIIRIPRFDEYPIYFERAKGCRAWDVDGNEFLDFLCSIGPIILGYAYDRVDEAVRHVIEQSFQSPMNTPHQIHLAELLAETVPSCEESRFFKTGSEATHAAVRLARAITGKEKIARSGYHGWFDLWREPQMAGVHAGTCAPVIPWDRTLDCLETTLRSDPDGFAAVTICPSEVEPFARETFRGIIDLAHQYGALAIFDEVKTGFRPALGGVQEIMHVHPDLTILSKGIANGYPLAVVCGPASVMEQIIDNPTTGTFNVEALSLAAAIATIEELKEKDVPSHLMRMGQRLIDGLNAITNSYGIDASAFPDPIAAMPNFRFTDSDSDAAQRAHTAFYSEVIRHGLFLCDWHMGFTCFSHQEQDIDEALDICDAVLRHLRI